MENPQPAENLPAFKSHKIVHAAQIVGRIGNGDGTHLLDLGVHGFVDVDAAWWTRNPTCVPGFYFVQYADGYTSASPAKAFEEGYTRVQPRPEVPPDLNAMADALAEARKLVADPKRAFTERTVRSIIGGLVSILDVDPVYANAVVLGEPVFPIRGQDIHSGSTVRDWAARVRLSGGLESKVSGAIEIAQRMEAWPVKKNPD